MQKMLCLFMLLSATTAGAQLNKINKDSLPSIHIKTVPPDYYSTNLGYVCKQELKFQQTLGVKFYFRLGSKEYVDMLEQKSNRNIKW